MPLFSGVTLGVLLQTTRLCLFSSHLQYDLCYISPYSWFKNKRLTPCLQACSFRALTQVLCQCSLKDLKENREVNKPLTPASGMGPTSRPKPSFSRNPHTLSARLWWSCVRGSGCRAGPLPSCLAIFLDLHRCSTVSKYWNSHPSTMSKEVRKRPTRHSQHNSCSSITASWSLAYHQFQMEISGLSVRAEQVPVACEWQQETVSHLDSKGNEQVITEK